MTRNSPPPSVDGSIVAEGGGDDKAPAGLWHRRHGAGAPPATWLPITAVLCCVLGGCGAGAEGRGTGPEARAEPGAASPSATGVPTPGAVNVPSEVDGPRGTPHPSAERPAAGSPCEQRLATARRDIEAVVSAHRPCRFNHDCVAVAATTGCEAPCPVVVAASGVAPLRAALEAIDGDTCRAFEANGCDRREAECARATPRCAAGSCAIDDGDAPLIEIEIPPENARTLTAAPPRPPVGDADERARRLLDAIVHNDPVRAADFFFPLEAFVKVKAMGAAVTYWQRLMDRYAVDIHGLHSAVPADAAFDHLEIVRRGGFVLPGEEGNHLPYHAARHNRLHFTSAAGAGSIEVRVLITWGDRWYITHLSEFH